LKKHRQEVAFLWNVVMHTCHRNVTKELTMVAISELEDRLKNDLMASLYRCFERALCDELDNG